jgi:hypothetical protein
MDGRFLSGLTRRPEQSAVPLPMAWKHPGIEKHSGTGGLADEQDEQ